MPDINPQFYALLTMIGRCLSGQWLIEPTWLHQHADLMLRADQGEDLTSKWPKMSGATMIQKDGFFAAAEKGDTIGKGSAYGVINMVGPIYKYGYNSSKMLMAYLRAMESDERIGGIKLVVDSPGGMVHGTREVFETIKNFSKPVLSVIDGYAASAAYYQIAGSSRIVATQPNDQIGSIGTYQSMADWNAFYKSMGLPFYDVYATASTEKNEAYRQVIESEGKHTELAKKQLDAYNGLFVADVQAGRGDRLTGKGQDPMKGRLFFPSEAVTNGLIDEQISEGESLALLADMLATSKQSSITMDFKSFLSSLGNLVKTAESAQGAEGGQQNAQPTVEQLQQQLAQANTQIGTLTTERDNATQEVTKLTTERDDLKGKVTAFGAQPGAMGTQAQKGKDDSTSDEPESWEKVVAGLEHNKEADAIFGK
ncbi:S49 family peptidase [Dyadobacter sp. SG02]|uniref:S49 family peptidase n=1 Tax=Dyadobacter sp. SG02 TaxID=1855291 RepID=UPI0015A5574F|nr:S49 family peptidase [Dyadobacter sp. SG02]